MKTAAFLWMKSTLFEYGYAYIGSNFNTLLNFS